MPGPNLLAALRAHLQTGEVPESLRDTLAGAPSTVPLQDSPGGWSSPSSPVPAAPTAHRPRTTRSAAPRDAVRTVSGTLDIDDLGGPEDPPAAGLAAPLAPVRVSPAGEVEPGLPDPGGDVQTQRRLTRRLDKEFGEPAWVTPHTTRENMERKLTTDDTLAADLQASLELVGAGSLGEDADGHHVLAPQPAPITYDLPVDLDALPLFAYVCGAAGVGKTWWAKEVARRGGAAVCLAATTGIASVNLGEGTTINSLLRYFDTASLREAFTGGFLEAMLKKHRNQGLERILLDEVSMLSGEQLTLLCRAIDNVNADKPEGVPDLGLILLGDFAQLAPVPDRDPRDPKGFKKLPTVFAFESAEWARFAAHTFTLSTIRRQADRDFIEALQACRRGAVGAAIGYFGPRMVSTTDMQFPGPTIVAKNDAVAKYNQLRLDAVPGAKIQVTSQRWGKVRPEWGAPPKPEAEWGVPPVLRLKEGCRVMILANKNVAGKDEPPVWAYTNGDLGTLVSGEDAAGAKVVLDRTGTEVWVGMLQRFNEIPLEPGRRKALKLEGHPERVSEDGKREYIGGITYLPIRLAYCTTVHKCVSADTRIRTVTRGIVAIQDLHVGDALPAGVILGTAASVQVAYRLRTQLGYEVITSADHRWVTDHGLCEAQALLPGVDRVQLAVGGPSGGADFSEETAYWLGLLVGDGNYTDRDDGTLHFASVTDPDLGEAFARGALRLGAQRCSWRKDRRGLHTSCQALRRQLAAWGLEYVTAPHKRIPAIIWSAHSGVWAAFLRGLFDADGSVGTSGVVLCTASEMLGREVQELLLALGVVSRRSRYAGRRDPYWQVFVSARGLGPFKSCIGFGSIRKRRRLAETLPQRMLGQLDSLDTVDGLEPLNIDLRMCDVEITAPHLLGLGPFQGSNSQGLSLDQVQINIRDSFFAQPGMLYVALSRARTVDGLRLVGTPEGFRARCTVNPKLKGYL